ncbi:hypothetical protein JMA_27460 [Jeotgalibacillus malaysiensis]|uniref:DUF6906 domain-containing protein n=1 Tax=Jeotgalibacillus malaysiensis TaxID=1508404 RepID=A0A0B5AU08_9BACL|nr:hypothetical protein [Jeotgalibacillus malaysiensis]AJD92063.1 hypothetical protein JMA_27460 [Jeotgalibacillus malaysiensis]
MKSGKRPSRAERYVLIKYGCNPRNWLISKKVEGRFLLRHRLTDQTKEIPNE